VVGSSSSSISSAEDWREGERRSGIIRFAAGGGEKSPLFGGGGAGEGGDKP
jgi:hypothetical protein